MADHIEDARCRDRARSLIVVMAEIESGDPVATFYLRSAAHIIDDPESFARELDARLDADADHDSGLERRVRARLRRETRRSRSSARTLAERHSPLHGA